MTHLTSQLVSTQWLADHLGADKLVIVDASVFAATPPHTGFVTGHEKYLIDGHIPGAVFGDLIDAFSDPEGRFPFTRPSKDRLEDAAGSLGIDNESTVVVYDAAVGQWASRLWWLFRSWGYDNVAILDGGFTKWQAEERPLEFGHVDATAATFEAIERPGLWVDKHEVRRIAAGEVPGSLVCASPPKDYSGEASPRARAGHIPGSISVPAAHIVDRSSNALLHETTLRERFAPALEDDRIVTYCGAGIAASSDAFVLTLLGHRNVAVFDGSLNEWAADPELELVTGA